MGLRFDLLIHSWEPGVDEKVHGGSLKWLGPLTLLDMCMWYVCA